MFTQEQLKGFARWVLTGTGGLVAGWFAAKGWFTVDQVKSVLNSEAAVGIVLAIISLIWNQVSKTKFGTIVAAAQANPEAKIITTQANAAATPALPNVVAGAPAVTGL